jgi:hypothetical protein
VLIRESGNRCAPWERAISFFGGGTGGMATSMLAASEPVGIVIRDGGDAHRTPRILMWFWASEEEANDQEEWRERR